jgi:hypothetical protein
MYTILVALFVIVIVNSVIRYLWWRYQRVQTGGDGSDAKGIVLSSGYTACI